MWQLSGSPGVCPHVIIIITPTPCLSLFRDCWDILDTERSTRGHVPLLSQNICTWDLMMMCCLPARRRRYNIVAVAPETNGQWVTTDQCPMSGDHGERWSQWAPCLTVLPGSSLLGSGHLRFYWIPIFVILKLPTLLKRSLVFLYN